jgi:YhcH/YjgK/YiaL family protein
LGCAGGSDAQEHDIYFYRQPEDMSLFPVKEGMFAVFFPEDTHAPCIGMSEKKASLKAVFKVRMN